MSEEIKILAMPNSAVIAAESIKLLRQKGVVIVRCDELEKVKMLSDDPTVSALPANEMLWAAVDAMGRNYSSAENSVSHVRKAFVQNMAHCLKKISPEPKP